MTNNPGKAPDVFYTGQGRANDVCTVTGLEKGKDTGAGLSQVDGDMSFKAGKQADLFKIQAGKKRYEIPEAVVFGG